MSLIFRYIKKYGKPILIAILFKLISTLTELLLPYVLEYMIDDIVPTGQLKMVIAAGLSMFAIAIIARTFNVAANRRAVENAHNISYDIRQKLFEKTINLSGSQFDSFGLPSLISRMTSDSYNVQTAVQQLQSLCVRAPMMLIGGVIMTLFMDHNLAMILVVMLPVLIFIILFVSAKGIPLYTTVQQKLDTVVRLMRENITGIRVVKALSKEDYEKRRFEKANEDMTKQDIKAAAVMAIPGPTMQLFLNCSLTVVVLYGAERVNNGLMKPGVILAFLTYFNMITMGVMGLSRIFMTMSKASASADRIDQVLQTPDADRPLPLAEGKQPSGDEFIRFENVNFTYNSQINPDAEQVLYDISFALKKGESLGIIGPTGSGKSTIISLLMHFYDVTDGGIFVNGRDVRTYDKDELRSMFGTVFQNDMIFQDTLRENINFGRNIPDDQINSAVEHAMAADYVNGLDDGLDHEMAIRGANASGGQKQRIFIARALANKPQILVLDDSSSALDYKTDAELRKAIHAYDKDMTMIMIAQRVSSVMSLSHILVLDEGHCIGYGTHEELLKTCDSYRETYEIQMGSID